MTKLHTLAISLTAVETLHRAFTSDCAHMVDIEQCNCDYARAAESLEALIQEETNKNSALVARFNAIVRSAR